jgi:hypothetical protein
MSGSVNRKTFGFWIASYYQIGPVFRKLLDVDIKSSPICKLFLENPLEYVEIHENILKN